MLVLLRYFFSSRKIKGWEKTLEVLNPLLANSQTDECFFFPRGADRLGQLMLLFGVWCSWVPQERCVASMLFLMENSTLSNWSLQGFALCSHTGEKQLESGLVPDCRNDCWALAGSLWLSSLTNDITYCTGCVNVDSEIIASILVFENQSLWWIILRLSFAEDQRGN